MAPKNESHLSMTGAVFPIELQSWNSLGIKCWRWSVRSLIYRCDWNLTLGHYETVQRMGGSWKDVISLSSHMCQRKTIQRKVINESSIKIKYKYDRKYDRHFLLKIEMVKRNIIFGNQDTFIISECTPKREEIKYLFKMHLTVIQQS